MELMHWKGRRQSQRKPQWGERPGAIKMYLLLLVPAAALGEELGVFVSLQWALETVWAV